jgi:hypothetical protein
MEKSQLGSIPADVAYALFGDDSYINPEAHHVLMKDSIQIFIKSFISVAWGRFRKAIKRDLVCIDNRRKEVYGAWLGKPFTLFPSVSC